ncbi:MAG: HlyD family secretion protein [Cytophagales bacterium]|jgi:HlyD family secretion protein|nr:HlyD family secretion protein [Cytophagales bacterium]
MPQITLTHLGEEPGVGLRSEPVQEIISQPPNWLVRWGTTVFFFVIALLLATSWVVQYPDLVKARFVLTSTNAPKSVNARVEGKIVKLLVQENGSVEQGQALAYLESTANHEQVLDLSNNLDLLANGISQTHAIAKTELSFAEQDGLGELQTAFQSFTQAYQQYTAFLSGGFYERKKKLLQKELSDLQLLAQNLEKQKELHARDFALAENEFRVQEKLLNEKVIAPLEFKREESKLLAKKMPLQQMETGILNNISAQTGKQKEILELEKLVAEQKSIFQQALNTMRSQTEDWKKKYLLTAPVSGKVYFSSFLQENQTVKPGQEVFFVGVDNSREYGEVRIPQHNFGKIKNGQKVWVKFNSYPAQEFGMVEGRIEYVSQIPGKDSTFLAKVVLPHGLQTNYRRKLTYKDGMTATADIVTLDVRLIEKIFYDIRRAFQR